MPAIDTVSILRYQLSPSLSESECRLTFTVAGWSIIVGVMIAEVILVFRTWALWGCSKILGICLTVLCIGIVVSACYFESIFLKSIVFAQLPNLPTNCAVISGNPIVALNFIFVIVVETIVLALTLIKGVQHYRLAENSGFLYVLYRDGVLFYFYLLGFSLLNLIFVVATPHGSPNMLALVQRILHSCLSARVLINLREAHSPHFPSADESTLAESFNHLTSIQTTTSENLYGA